MHIIYPSLKECAFCIVVVPWLVAQMCCYLQHVRHSGSSLLLHQGFAPIARNGFETFSL